MSLIDRIRLKRLNGDLKLLKKEPLKYIRAYPFSDDMLTWYFLIKGPEFSDYNNGYYIGKIVHNNEYPMKPPNFYMLTPNGRFSINKKICLSNSSYHSNEWSVMWNIKSILVGFLSIMLDDNENGISHIHCSKLERKQFASNSLSYNKIHFQNILDKFNDFIIDKKVKVILKLINFDKYINNNYKNTYLDYKKVLENHNNFIYKKN